MALTTSQLILSKLTIDDAAFILTLFNDPDFINNIQDKQIKTLSQAEAFIQQGPIQSYKQYGYGPMKIVLRSQQTPIGLCGLLNRQDQGVPYPDLACALLPDYRQQGYSFEAVKGVLEYAVTHHKITQFAILVAAHNQRSMALIKKWGLIFSGKISLPGYKQTLLYTLDLSQQ